VNHYGIDPMIAIRAATYWPAVAMKAEARTGTIEQGKDADIIAVRGDVLTHINLLSDIDVVIRHGVRHK
jgi:imidazolonepropionase-like amidohydrolase